MLLLMGPPIVYQTSTKSLWNPRVKKFEKNTMGMAMHRIVEQTGKVDPKEPTEDRITPEGGH